MVKFFKIFGVFFLRFSLLIIDFLCKKLKKNEHFLTSLTFFIQCDPKT